MKKAISFIALLKGYFGLNVFSKVNAHKSMYEVRVLQSTPKPKLIIPYVSIINMKLPIGDVGQMF